MSHDDDLVWLRGEPPIDELVARFPREWAELGEVARRRHAAGGDEALKDYVLTALSPPRRRGRDHAVPRRVQVAREVRRRMLLELLRQRNLAVETGRAAGTVRFGRINAWMLQRLFFDGPGLRRKPVSLLAYRVVWPLAWERRLLMPLVRRRGVYCFYSARFVRDLARLVGDRSCVEVAAGDGTLSRFLAARGVPVRASDDYSWEAHVDHDVGLVERLDAVTAVRRYEPEVVICSWPPPGNDFEHRVLREASVRTYVVILSSSDADAGDWTAYRSAGEYDVTEDRVLERGVLPRGGSRVLVLRRRDP